jgi:hypothetical protein
MRFNDFGCDRRRCNSVANSANIAPTRPTLPPPKKCFETTKELKDAVDIIILDSDAAMFLEQTYGLPMGTWCVSNIQDFSGWFSAFRNSNAATFNDNIEGWDVSMVSTMNAMFMGATSFDQDLSS